ncbi:MAG: AtpZ/AtpI family protein [Chloroflexi bacterium]|nr:AtpZ/AtpI family protein [Chloroflexota bacterium]
MSTRQPNGPDRRPRPDDAPRNWGLVLDLGMRLGLSVIIGILAGVVIDGWAGTRPLFTLLGVVVGVGAAMYSIWDVARDSMRPR